MPKKEKQNQPLAKVAFRFPGSLPYMLQCSCQTQVFLLKPEKSVERRNQRKGGQGIWRLDGLSKASIIFPSWPTSHGLVPPDRFCWQRPRWNCANRMRPIPFVRAPHKRTTGIRPQRRKVSWIQEKGQEVFRQADF